MRQDVEVDEPGDLPVDHRDLAAREDPFAHLFEDQHRVEDRLALGREGGDALHHAVGLDLLLGHPDMLLTHARGVLAVRELARDPEEVKRPPGVAMLLRRERRAERDDRLVERPLDERHIGPLLEDVAELGGVIGGEDDLFLGERGEDTGVQKVGEPEIVGYPDDADLRELEVGVDPGEVVEGVVAALLDEFVDLVKDDDHDPAAALELVFELHVDLVGRPPGHRDEAPGAVAWVLVGVVEAVCDLGENAVLGIDHLTVEVDDPALRSGEGARVLKFRPDVPDRGCLPGPGLAVDEDV